MIGIFQTISSQVHNNFIQNEIYTRNEPREIWEPIISEWSRGSAGGYKHSTERTKYGLLYLPKSIEELFYLNRYEQMTTMEMKFKYRIYSNLLDFLLIPTFLHLSISQQPHHGRPDTNFLTREMFSYSLIH